MIIVPLSNTYRTMEYLSHFIIILVSLCDNRPTYLSQYLSPIELWNTCHTLYKLVSLCLQFVTMEYLSHFIIILVYLSHYGIPVALYNNFSHLSHFVWNIIALYPLSNTYRTMEYLSHFIIITLVSLCNIIVALYNNTCLT